LKHYIKALRRITALILAALVVVGVIPPEVVFANQQAPVRVLTPGGIVNNTAPVSALHGPYDFTLHWQWQDTWADPTMTPGLTNPGIHQPEGFDIEWRNASRGESFLTAGANRREPGLSVGTRNWDFRGPLTSGSIYSFRVVPWHWHYFPPSPVPPHMTPPPARITPPASEMVEVLYLTDIEIELEVGAMGGMLITWDNPLYNSQQVFSGYRIEFRAAGGGWQTGITVSESTPGVERLAGGSRWRYEFVHQNLRPGTQYDVRITPLIGGDAINVRPTVQIGGTMFNIASSGRDYVGTGFYLSPLLTLRPEGLEYLSLTWSMPDPAHTRITHIRIWYTTAGVWDEATQMYVAPADFPNPARDNIEHTIVNLLGTQANHHLVPRPTEVPTWYVVELMGYVLATGFPIGSGPAPQGPGMFTNVVWFDPEFDAFAAYSPTIREIDHHGTPNNLSLEITWRAFTRAWFRPMDDHLQPIPPRAEDGGVMRVIDNQLYFDVYITDAIENLEGNISPIARVDGRSLIARELDAYSMTGIPGATEWFYTHSFDRFTNSTGQVLPLEDNTIYYVRIVAVRQTRAYGPIASQPAYGSHYIPPLQELPLPPLAVPIRIKEDDDGNQVIGENYIGIQWNRQWFEVYNAETNSWYDVIGRTDEGDLVFGRAAEGQDSRVRLWEFDPAIRAADVRNIVMRDLGITGEEQAQFVLRERFMDVYHPRITNYEIHVVPYDVVSETGDSPYVEYLAGILQNRAAWQSVQLGQQMTDNPNFRDFIVTGLEPNTSYVIFFRPINQVGPARYPSYVAGTTVAERPDMDIHPTTPRLEVVRSETTESSITLRWNGSFEFIYELYMSELIINYPTEPRGASGGDRIPWDLIRQNAVEEDGWIYFTVEGLFPYTMYHFWIRAINHQNNISVWSNPVSERTLDIAPPVPPIAIALASGTSLTAYNTENSTDLAVGRPNELIIEWMRIFNDINNPAPGPRRSGYEVTSGDNATWLDSLSLPVTYMVMFEELVANRWYYVRISTILTVTRGSGPTGITRAYSYRFQLSTSDEFIDYVEIIVPAYEPLNETPGQMRRRESVWSEVFRFRAGWSDDEYDHWNPDLFPLPDRDWELIYDPRTGTLTFRFRTNQIDATGQRDQNVDQRFITRAVQSRRFHYPIDMTTYGGRQVTNGVVVIPYSIMQAFAERQIALEVTLGNVTVSFTPGALATPEVMGLADIGPETMVRLMIDAGDSNAPTLDVGANYASRPRRVSAQVVTPTRTINVDNFAQPVNLTFAIDSQALLMEQNVGLYTSHSGTRGWERVAATHSPVSGDFVFNTRRAGNFAAIAQAAPPQTMPNDPSRDAFLRVTSRVSITDMQAYNPTQTVSPNAFNNMVAAVAMNRRTVALNAPLSNSDTQSLTRAQMYVPGPAVTREAAMVVLVNLYEQMTRRIINPAVAPPPDLASADPANHDAMMKAAHLGFFSGAANPQGILTMGDFMQMLDIIIMDAG